MSKKIDIDKLSETQMTSKDLEELKERISEIQKQKIIDDLLKMKNQFVEYCEENNLDLTDAFELVGFTKGGMFRKTKAKFKDPVTGKLWAGRGKTPKWYLERITQGFTEQDLLA